VFYTYPVASIEIEEINQGHWERSNLNFGSATQPFTVRNKWLNRFLFLESFEAYRLPRRSAPRNDRVSICSCLGASHHYSKSMATRNPVSSLRLVGKSRQRFAERISCGGKLQAPPRITRLPQPSFSTGEPSFGASEKRS